MPAREEAIRQARRLGDPAAICAALAVTSAWETDETRGRNLAERFVAAGLLTAEQVSLVVGAEVATEVSHVEPVPAVLEAGRARDGALQIEPEAVSLAVLDAPGPPEASHAEPFVASPPASTPAPTVATPCASEVGAAEAPAQADPRPSQRASRRTSRAPLAVAALLGVAVALGSWFSLGGGRRPALPSPDRPSIPPVGPSALAKENARIAPHPAAPMPSPPPRVRPPGWAPMLRQVRQGDAPAIHDRLHHIERQLIAEANTSAISFDARQVLTRAPRKDRIVCWIELRLARFHAIAELRVEGVDVVWAREETGYRSRPQVGRDSPFAAR